MYCDKMMQTGNVLKMRLFGDISNTVHQLANVSSFSATAIIFFILLQILLICRIVRARIVTV